MHAYCLIPNHYHLVLETPQPNPVAGMKWLLGVYTKRYNVQHKLCRHLFAGRYKALVVPLRRDWVLGSEEFRQELLAAAAQRVGPNQYGAERQETGVQKAERSVREQLGRMGGAEDGLRGRAKGHSGKVVIARRGRQETTMSLKWIAE